MSLWDKILEFFGWSAEEREEELHEVEVVAADVEMAIISGDAEGAVAAIEDLEHLAQALDMDVGDLASEDDSLIIELVQDWQDGQSYEMELLGRLEGESEEFIAFAAELGAMSAEDIEAARELYYETEYELAALFETIEEALDYVEGVSPGVLEIVEREGIYEVYRTYKD